MPERGRCFSIGEAVAVNKERLEATARNSAREKGEQEVIGQDRSRFPGRRTVWEVTRG